MQLNKEFITKYENLVSEDSTYAIEFCINELSKTKNKEIYIFLADAYMAEDNFKKAIEILEKWLTLGGDDICGLNLLGEAYFYLEDYIKSKNAFNKIIKIDKFNFFARIYLTDIYIWEKRYIDAFDNMFKLLQSKKISEEDRAFVEAKIGWIKLKYLNEIEDSSKYFLSSIKRDFSCGTAYIGLGTYNLKLENYKEALRNYEIALELGENCLELQEGLNKAKNEIEKVIRM
ncbi:hypothetical protein JCM1393_26140 [Clostridium carnis]